MKSSILFPLISILSTIVNADTTLGSSGKIQFSGVGYDFSYQPISKINNGNKNCYCELSDNEEWVSGTNTPFNEYLAVHVRGPTKLSKFAYYISSNFTIGNSSTSTSWNRSAFFDNTEDFPTMENITFLGHQGDDSSCLGKALTYIGQDGRTPQKTNTAPGKYMQDVSNVEYIIYSNVSCPKSSVNGGCGVYRSGIPAFYGFGGVTKMFLFEFSMPTDSSNDTGISYFNAPNIWLGSDSQPRVLSQPGFQSNCSCIFQGCGEFQVFSANATKMNSSMLTLQGLNGNTSLDIQSMYTNMDGYGSFDRPINTTVTGGVVFDSSGNVVSFLSSDIAFDEQLTSSSVNAILADIPELGTTKQLKAGIQTAPTTTSSSNSALPLSSKVNNWMYIFTIATTLLHNIMW
ncbi:similar to Saccharomyces cerevisiae YJL171C GPI-anchored cell wall protein of unknown function [Maudiozyma saulgeensis]|uniref:glucan endo-1,3-beta-D-glucosidase n=1 Tax=Maudiozyma saulgeensis TaxID=1789683 RepID=A0A1X7RB85_9SACH|nr:similar to Saccharomyces cerevisiae YJL171C GPI-anchored cell wall protein of unknown function [Kazachstania saulgeensis]